MDIQRVGSVAIYSAISAPSEIQDRIIKVYNYDGPGLDDEVINNNQNKDIIKKIHTYIPQDSIIGRILEHQEKCDVVQSLEKGIYQHDIYSWQVLRDSPIIVESVTENSDMVNQTVKTWLHETTPEQRKIFVDGIFEIFYATKVDTFSELSGLWVKKVPTFVYTYSGLSEDERKTMTTMLKEFGKTYFLNVKENEVSKLKKLTHTT